jgi:NADH-quinone oxidoreductase subunit L
MVQLAALIPFIPFLGFLVNGLGFPKISKSAAGWIGCGSVFISFLISSLMFARSLTV